MLDPGAGERNQSRPEDFRPPEGPAGGENAPGPVSQIQRKYSRTIVVRHHEIRRQSDAQHLVVCKDVYGGACLGPDRIINE